MESFLYSLRHLLESSTLSCSFHHSPPGACASGLHRFYQCQAPPFPITTAAALTPSISFPAARLLLLLLHSVGQPPNMSLPNPPLPANGGDEALDPRSAEGAPGGSSGDCRVESVRFISFSPSRQDRQQDRVVEAIRALSSYMIFLLVERPYMLPIPVRPGLYANAELEFHLDSSSDPKVIIQDIEETYGAPPAFAHGAEFGKMLLDKEVGGHSGGPLLQVVLGVWVEMLCYAGQHCSRDSHARQLSSGGEFITVVWLLTTAMFNHFYCEEPWFEDGMKKFFTPRSVYKPGFLVRLFRWCTDLILVCCGIPTTAQKWKSIVKD